MSKCTAFAVCALFLHFGNVALSREEAVFSGPQPGEKLASLKVVTAYGEQRGHVVSLATNDQPTLLVFVHGANRPAARLTRVLMNYAEMRGSDKLSAATI